LAPVLAAIGVLAKQSTLAVLAAIGALAKQSTLAVLAGALAKQSTLAVLESVLDVCVRVYDERCVFESPFHTSQIWNQIELRLARGFAWILLLPITRFSEKNLEISLI
jgi:hypothetical protein